MTKKKNKSRPQDVPVPPESRNPRPEPEPEVELPLPDLDLPAEGAHPHPTKKPTAPGNPFYGCVILLIAALTFSFIVLWTIYSGLKQSAEIDGFTVLAPEPLPEVQVSEEQKSTVLTKLNAFATVAKNNKPVTLTLTLDELNTLLVLAGEKGVADYRGMVRFTGLDARAQALKADIRWKMNNLPFVQAAERFLVGQAAFKPVIENNALELHIESVKVPGKLVSEGFMRQLRNWPWLNLAKLKPEVSAPLSKVTRFEFSEDGTLLALHCGETVQR